MEKGEWQQVNDRLSRREVLRGIIGGAALVQFGAAMKVLGHKQKANTQNIAVPEHDIEFVGRMEQSMEAKEPDINISWLPDSVTRWRDKIMAASEEFSVDPELISILMTLESTGVPSAVSHAGAQGLMQVMPSTAEGIAKSLQVDTYDLKDPETNLRFGTYYLRELLDRFQPEDEEELTARTVKLVAVGYNGGPGCTLDLLDGLEIPDEPAVYSRYASEFWQERHQDRSVSFEEWSGTYLQ